MASKLLNKEVSDLFIDGDIDKIIDALKNLRAQGYKELYWDGYNAKIEVLAPK